MSSPVESFRAQLNVCFSLLPKRRLTLLSHNFCQTTGYAALLQPPFKPLMMTTILNNNNALLTPDHRSSEVMSVLRSIQEPPDEEPSWKKQRYVHLTSDQFTTLLQCYEKQQQDIASLMQTRPSPGVTPPESANHATSGSL
jgi:hypothetical protein